MHAKSPPPVVLTASEKQVLYQYHHNKAEHYCDCEIVNYKLAKDAQKWRFTTGPRTKKGWLLRAYAFKELKEQHRGRAELFNQNLCAGCGHPKSAHYHGKGACHEPSSALSTSCRCGRFRKGYSEKDR